jgi:hypothetical protein
MASRGIVVLCVVATKLYNTVCVLYFNRMMKDSLFYNQSSRIKNGSLGFQMAFGFLFCSLETFCLSTPCDFDLPDVSI